MFFFGDVVYFIYFFRFDIGNYELNKYKEIVYDKYRVFGKYIVIVLIYMFVLKIFIIK